MRRTSRSTSRSSLILRFDVRAHFEVLCEMADGAGDFFVFVRGEGDGGDEADGEPRPVWGVSFLILVMKGWWCLKGMGEEGMGKGKEKRESYHLVMQCADHKDESFPIFLPLFRGYGKGHGAGLTLRAEGDAECHFVRAR
ncbi:MAG: hypothetical protein Q9215_005798 [Flavoplaca cf. flavocitrina]